MSSDAWSGNEGQLSKGEDKKREGTIGNIRELGSSVISSLVIDDRSYLVRVVSSIQTAVAKIEHKSVVRTRAVVSRAS